MSGNDFETRKNISIQRSNIFTPTDSHGDINWFHYFYAYSEYLFTVLHHLKATKPILKITRMINHESAIYYKTIFNTTRMFLRNSIFLFSHNEMKTPSKN